MEMFVIIFSPGGLSLQFRGKGGGGVLEVEDFLFRWQLDANAAECFVIMSLITTSIIT